MNKSIDFSHLGGLLLTQDALAFLQSSFAGPLDSFGRAIGDKLIVSGLEAAGSTIGDGWILYNGEFLPFTGGFPLPFVIIEDEVANEMFDDSQERPVYLSRRARFGNVIGTGGGFPYAEIRRLPFGTVSILDSLTSAARLFRCSINHEREVILEGCQVQVNGTSIRIEPGMVMFDGKLVFSPAFEGGFPVFLSAAGSWVSAAPSAGLFVRFDPYTSQNYKDVLFRINHRPGQLVFNTTLSDRFDPVTGIGRWEWYGFRLSETMRGKVPGGYWFGDSGSDPDTFDPRFREVGEVFGALRHRLTRQELPAADLETEVIGDNGWPKDSGHRSSNGDQYLLSPNAANKNNRRLKISTGGADAPHNNVQPTVILVVAERYKLPHE